MEVEALPLGPKNPMGNAIKVNETAFNTESEGQRMANPLAGRYWKVVNPAKLNPVTGTISILTSD